MKHTIQKLLGILVTVLGVVPCTQGQQIPAIAEGQAIVRTTLTDNRISMRDAENDRAIMLPSVVTFAGLTAGIVGNVRLQEQPTGFDLIYTFENTGTQATRLGRLQIGKFNMGRNITYRDYRHVGEPKTADYTNYSFQSFKYPSGIYSPVWTLYNDDYAVSVSLQYPILDYKHEARIMLGSTPVDAPVSQGPRGWYLEYRLANHGDEPESSRLTHSAMLPAGATWTYVVSVRVTKNQSEWIRTLTPYRDYFRSMYGGVQYARDPRPVKPQLVAVDHLISEANPYGFDNFRNRRPDLNGWKPWSDYIKSQSDQWSRVMLWAPSGLFNENRNMNFPFMFTSRWLLEDRMANAFDENEGLASIGRNGQKLGLWWGRSTQVIREWNSAQWERFDPDNPAHVQAALHEMDIAVRAGATEIGLDTFTPGNTPIWKLLPWLQRMRETYPEVKFIIEPATCDILHRLAGSFVIGWGATPIQQESDLFKLTTPYYLADLLLPGHESWGCFSYHRHRSNNYPVTPEIVQRDAEIIAGNGYVPVMMDTVPTPENVRAVESWLTTLPADVLRGSGWNTTPSNPYNAFRRADGRLVVVGSSPGGAPARPTTTRGRVAGSVPTQPAANGGLTTPPVNPRIDADEGDNMQAPADTPAVAVEPAAPIQRDKRKIKGSVTVQRPDPKKKQPVAVQTEPAMPGLNDMPGSRADAGIEVPSNAGGKSGKGGAKTNPAWLREMIKKGYMDRSKMTQGVKGNRNSARTDSNIVIVPSND